MTYDQAMEYKRNLPPEVLARESYTHTVVVVPADPNDFYRYLRELPDRKPIDSDAKYHSSNGTYRVVFLGFEEVPVEYEDV